MTQFNFLGVPVRVHGAFWVLGLLFGFLRHRALLDTAAWILAVWFFVMFTAVLFHEMGHALTGRFFGLNPEVDHVFGGGLTRFPTGRKLSHGQSILVSFAGPLVGLAIGIPALVIVIMGMVPGLPGRIVEDIAFTNFGWAVFNLIPIVGLDGGNMMAAAFDRFFGRRGVRSARVISIFIAVAICTLMFALFREGALFTLFIMGSLAMNNYRAWQAESQWADRLENQVRVHKRPANAPRPGETKETIASIGEELREGWSALEAGDVKKVRRLAEGLAVRVRSAEDKYETAHLLAWGRLLTGAPDLAQRALQNLPGGRQPDALIEGAIALELGDAERAVDAFAEAVVDRSDDFVASRFARAVAQSGKVDRVRALIGDRAKSETIGVRPFQLIAQALFETRRYEDAATIGELLFERWHDANDAFNVACSLAQAGRASDAIVWLDRAIDAGLHDVTVLDSDQDLAPVRELAEFEALRVKASARNA